MKKCNKCGTFMPAGYDYCDDCRCRKCKNPLVYEGDGEKMCRRCKDAEV